MQDTTTIITEVIELLRDQPTVVVGSINLTKHIQVEQLAKHARTMIMMFNATHEARYLKQARLDIMTAQEIKAGHKRPLGAHQAA